MGTEALEQAIKSTRAVLANVSPDQLDAPTPCKNWKVGELINHIVGGQHFFATAVAGEEIAGGDTDFSAGDYLTEFDRASEQCLAAFRADGAMDKMLTLPFGQMPGAAFVGLATTDTFTHGWDLAKATAQDTDLAPDLATALLEQSKSSIQDAFRSPDGAVFGPEQSAPDDASEADRLAAFLGRSV